MDDLIATGGTLAAGIKLVGACAALPPPQRPAPLPAASPAPAPALLAPGVLALSPPPCSASPPRLPPAEKVGAQVVECACVIELPFLEGRKKLNGAPLFVLIEKEGA